ncbi:MAG: hypothetical protein JSS86_15440 [Cyanobacteria bacterium SZAS LIN-2]|nr:hypothetical protein [Cyanobacteria bacterium SZAS LIN-3]MBS1997715.1 hypothetical protein [Cyanobacteria bacterium SZAS LIN-2]
MMKEELCDDRVEIKRSGSNVTWIFKNKERESVEFDMSFIRADTITALLKRSRNMGQGAGVAPRLLQGTMTQLYVFPDHYAIVFDNNPKLSLVRSHDQVAELIHNLEELSA